MNTTPNLITIGLARGTRLHLAEEGSTTTLCGIAHRVNPRYVTATRFTLPLEDATCPACKKEAAR